MDEKTLAEFLTLFSPSLHESLILLLSKEGVDALVCFENKMFDSPHFGERSALAVGPGCTYKSPEEVRGRHLGDLPSQRKYPIAFVTAST
jgi:hypothetical protein